MALVLPTFGVLAVTREIGHLNPLVSVDSLLSTRTVVELDHQIACERLAELIDASHDAGRIDGLEHGIRLTQELLDHGTSDQVEPLLHYFTGNAWAGIRILRATQQDAAWSWEQPEAREEILAFRRALGHQHFRQLDPVRRCQIATNLGNLMSNVGRFVEALAYYDVALDIDRGFGMALANRGDCLLHYARVLYDDGHRPIFARSALDLLDMALSCRLEPGVAPNLRSRRDHAARVAGRAIDKLENNDHHAAWSEPDETTFRTWALENRLFINPLNDIGDIPLAARDVLHLPTMHVEASVGSGFHGFFNQLKQEYAAARFVLHEGLKLRGAHAYADRDVGLLDTWNDTAFGIALEKVKLSFRSAYSLLDKVAVFIARYFRLPIPPHRVNMRSVWYVDAKPKNGLSPVFDRRENWPLRGLFWMSKDLHDTDPEFHEEIEPDARELARLRNQLEHQYARVEQRRVIRHPDEPDHVPPDPFGHVVTKAELEAKALRMLKTARAALIYLSLAVHVEELEKPSPPEGGVHRGQFPLRS